MSAHALVVLPFENASGDAAHDDIAVAITTDLTRGLSSLKDIVVIAASSARAIAAQSLGIAEIGRLARVGFVLRGQASIQNERVRISATLVRTEDQEQVWSEQVEGDFVALRDLERKMIASIANRLNAALLDAGPLAPLASMPDAVTLKSFLRANALASNPTSAQTITEAVAFMRRRSVTPRSVPRPKPALLRSISWLLSAVAPAHQRLPLLN